MSLLRNYQEKKIVKHLSNQIYKFYLTNMMYPTSYGRMQFYLDYKIVKREDLLNLDSCEELIFHHQGNWYMYLRKSFTTHNICRCQQGHEGFYKIHDNMYFERIDDLDLDIYEWYKFYQKSTHNGYPNEVDNADGPVYDFLQQYLDKPLIEPCDKPEDDHVLEGQWYRFYLTHFVYDSDLNFQLEVPETYYVVNNEFSFLYFVDSPVLGNRIYRQIPLYAACCGSGDDFFYHMKMVDWLHRDNDDIIKRKWLDCEHCRHKLIGGWCKKCACMKERTNGASQTAVA